MASKPTIHRKPDHAASDPALMHVTDAALMRELISRNGYGQAPNRVSRISDSASVLIAIGNDHTADLTLTEDALAVLETLK